MGSANEPSNKFVKTEGRWPIHRTYHVMERGELLGSISVDDMGIDQTLNRSVLDLDGEGEHSVCVMAPEYVEAVDFYAPLSIPDLFMQFAALADKRVTLEVMLDWIGRYGLLGLRNPEGDSTDTLRRFAEEAEKANSVLRLYEIVTAPDGPRPLRHHELMNYVITRPAVIGKLRLKASTTLEELRDALLRWATDTVNEVVTRECYPVLYGQKDEYRQGWGFRSLLGAMYLQMMQLITTAGEVPRCKGPDCPQIITFKLGEPYAGPGFGKNVRGKYKTRIDKEFCSTNCRVKWRYHNVIKPRRESERAATN